MNCLTTIQHKLRVISNTVFEHNAQYKSHSCSSSCWVWCYCWSPGSRSLMLMNWLRWNDDWLVWELSPCLTGEGDAAMGVVAMPSHALMETVEKLCSAEADHMGCSCVRVCCCCWGNFWTSQLASWDCHTHGRTSVGGQGDMSPLLFQLEWTPCVLFPPTFLGVDIVCNAQHK